MKVTRTLPNFNHSDSTSPFLSLLPSPFLPSSRFFYLFFPVPFFYLPSRPLPFSPAIALCISSCFSVSIWGGLERALLGLSEGVAWGVGWEGKEPMIRQVFSSIFDLSTQSYSFWWPPQHHLHKVFLMLFKLLSNKTILEFSRHNAEASKRPICGNSWTTFSHTPSRPRFPIISNCFNMPQKSLYRFLKMRQTQVLLIENKFHWVCFPSLCFHPSHLSTSPVLSRAVSHSSTPKSYPKLCPLKNIVCTMLQHWSVAFVINFQFDCLWAGSNLWPSPSRTWSTL